MLLRQENPDPLEQFVLLHTRRRLEVGRVAVCVCRGAGAQREQVPVLGVFPRERDNSTTPESQAHEDGSVLPGGKLGFARLALTPG